MEQERGLSFVMVVISIDVSCWYSMSNMFTKCGEIIQYAFNITHTHIHARTHTHTRMCVYIYIYTHIYIYDYICLYHSIVFNSHLSFCRVSDFLRWKKANHETSHPKARHVAMAPLRGRRVMQLRWPHQASTFSLSSLSWNMNNPGIDMHVMCIDIYIELKKIGTSWNNYRKAH